MAKTTKKRSKAKKTTPFWKNPEYNRRVGYALVVVIVLVAGGLFAKNQFEEYDSAQRFKQAESVVEDTYAQIVSRIGEPDQVERVRNCDRANLKNARGPLRCYYRALMYYSNTNLNKSNSLMDNISSLSPEEIRTGSISSDDSLVFVNSKTLSGEQVFYQDMQEYHDISCGFSYRYPFSSGAYIELFDITANTNFLISFGCGGRAKAEHYPLRD